MLLKPPRLFVFNVNVIPFLIFAILVLNTLPAINHAQEPSMTPDGSLGSNVALDQSNYTISEGTIRGSNQFHSFGQFNLFQGESATFTGPNTINNIIGRVTGGSQSFIDGLLRSEINGANLYLLNPGGVLFGPNASLDVSGSFHVSTADFLRLGDDGVFYARLSENSTLSIDPPSAFGFLGGNPAGITIQQSSLQVPHGETFSLVGGDIEIVGSGIPDQAQEVIVAPSGRVNIASVASAGEVAFNAPGEVPDLKMESFDRLGNINISSSAYINAIGNPGGNIIIRGGNFFLTESIMSAATNGDIDHPGIGVDIKVSDDLVLTAGELNAAEISTSSLQGATGDAGDIEIEAGSFQLTGAPEFTRIADIASRVFYSGDGGDIFIKTGSLHLNEFSGILAQVFGSGIGGDITIETDSLQIDGGPSLCFISTSTFAPWYTATSGDAGNLTVNAKEVVIQGGEGGFTGLASQVSTGIGDPNGGKISVNTDTLKLFDGAQFNAGIFSGAGQAGTIEVTADDILISGKNPGGFSAGIYSNVAGAATTGTGGDILINANDLQMKASGQIGTYSESPGNSGNIIVKTSNLTVSDGSYLSSTNFGTGEAGDIAVEADNTLVAGPSPENEFTGLFAIGGIFATGAGDIRVETDKLQVLDGAQITARTTGPGMGGKIDIIANHVDIGGVDPSSISIDGPNAGIFTSSTIFQGFVDQATGDAGDINIQANNLNLKNHATIGAFSTSRGDGGNININANNAISSSNSSISTVAEQAVGGDITLTARQVRLTNRTVISAESSGEGNAGNIDITAKDTFWMKDSAVTTEAKKSDGGNIKINTESMVIWDSEITASVGGGRDTVGGNINIDPEFVTLSNSKIIANAFEGRGGTIRITADVFIADLDSVVDASSQLGIDGVVDIRAPVKVVAQSLKPLSEEYKSAVALLREPCIARISGGKYSSFTVEGRDALPIEPGGLLPSPLIP
ncbi:MAG: filamentous hemagglutinin N-terminal domain-containing protein [Candidatus Zixiibacteriota bacterium]